MPSVLAVLENWQTLITGVLAVGAAYWTIRQMRASDIRQDARHSDLIRLTLKSERVIAFKAAIPHANNLKSLLDHISSILNGRPETEEDQIRALRNIHGNFVKIETLLDHSDLNAVRNLYSLDVHHALTSIDNSRQLFRETSNKIMLGLQVIGIGSKGNADRRWEPLQLRAQAEIAFNEIEPDCRRLINALGELLSYYDELFSAQRGLLPEYKR